MHTHRNTHRLRSPLSRQNLVTLTAAVLLLLVVVCGFGASRAQQASTPEGGREVVEKIPKHLPIKVKVKKPERLKDAQNEDWFDDVEIEVTNTGLKPIYFLRLHLALPEILAESGKHYVFLYHYGRGALADFGEPVQPTDMPISAGETVTIKPAADNIMGWKLLRGRGKVGNPNRLEFQFQEINHGDGTGFLGTGGAPIPTKR